MLRRIEFRTEWIDLARSLECGDRLREQNEKLLGGICSQRVRAINLLEQRRIWPRMQLLRQHRRILKTMSDSGINGRVVHFVWIHWRTLRLLRRIRRTTIPELPAGINTHTLTKRHAVRTVRRIVIAIGFSISHSTRNNSRRVASKCVDARTWTNESSLGRMACCA